MKPVKIARNLLIVPVSVFFIVLAVLPLASASDSGWTEFSIELGEGETKIVSLTVDNSAQISLVPLYSFVGVDSVVFFNPGAVGEGTTPISIHFTQMGAAEKEKIAPDMYRVKLVARTSDNREFPILVYLKLGKTPPSENIENEISALRYRLGVIEAQLENLLDEIGRNRDLAESVAIIDNTVNALEDLVGIIGSRIEFLENQPDVPENMIALVATLDEQVSLMENSLATLSAGLQDLKNNPSTNSDDIAALSNSIDELIQRNAEMSSSMGDLIAAMNANSSDVEGTKSGLATVYVVVIVLAIIVIGTALQRVPGIRKMRPIKMLTERQKKHSGPPVVIPDEDAQARAKYKAEAEKREREKLGQ